MCRLRTVAPVAMLDTGLQRLYANLGKFDYKHTNLLSCMTRCGKLPLHRTCKAGKHVKGRVLQIIRLDNERGGETRDNLGSILSYKQEFSVSQTRSSVVVVAGFCHETSTNRQ